MSEFATWLDTFVSEKGLDPDEMFVIETSKNTHMFDLAYLVEVCKIVPDSEQRTIKAIIVEIDFCNGNVLDYFNHLATILAKRQDGDLE